VFALALATATVARDERRFGTTSVDPGPAASSAAGSATAGRVRASAARGARKGASAADVCVGSAGSAGGGMVPGGDAGDPWSPVADARASGGNATTGQPRGARAG
jgi:hypothetical protein